MHSLEEATEGAIRANPIEVMEAFRGIVNNGTVFFDFRNEGVEYGFGSEIELDPSIEVKAKRRLFKGFTQVKHGMKEYVLADLEELMENPFLVPAQLLETVKRNVYDNSPVHCGRGIILVNGSEFWKPIAYPHRWRGETVFYQDLAAFATQIANAYDRLYRRILGEEPDARMFFSQENSLIGKKADVSDAGQASVVKVYGLWHVPETGNRPVTQTRPSRAAGGEPQKPKAISPERKQEKEGDYPRFIHVVGCDEAKREMLRAIDYFLNPQASKDWDIALKAGLLMTSRPGNGKTLLARALANEVEATFYKYKAGEILDTFHGGSERALTDLLARVSGERRSILLIDEFDGLARDRALTARSSHGTEARMVEILLEFLDGFERHDNVYLIGATNQLGIVDRAIKQRMEIVHIPDPDFAARMELVSQRIARHREKARFDPFTDPDLEKIAEASAGFSARQLVGEHQGVFLNLQLMAKERTEKQGTLYMVTTEDWLAEIARQDPDGQDLKKHIL